MVKAETASSSSYMAVNLIIQDVNDNLPRFQLQNYVAYIREAQGYDSPIIQVRRRLLRGTITSWDPAERSARQTENSQRIEIGIG